MQVKIRGVYPRINGGGRFDGGSTPVSTGWTVEVDTGGRFDGGRFDKGPFDGCCFDGRPFPRNKNHHFDGCDPFSTSTMKIFLLKIADPSDQFAIHMVSLYACERACFLEERGGGGEEEE